MVPEDPATGEPGTESFPPFSARLFGLKNAGFKNEWLPFSDPYCPTGERTANAFHLLNRVLWSVRDPWIPKASLG